MFEKEIFIDGIKILIVRKPKIVNLGISIKPFTGIKVTIPLIYGFEKGELFAKSKFKWIKRHYPKVLDYEKNTPRFDENSDISTKYHQIILTRRKLKSISCKINESIVEIRIPLNKDLLSMEVQRKIRKVINDIYKIEAKDYLPNRLKYLSQYHCLEFNTVTIKNIRSRWGSCSSKNNINLSAYLIRLPNHLIDYVLLHELAHIKVKNHSKLFWEFLNTLLPNAKQFDKELKHYHIRNY
ncbi:MAG: M48 family metallopeptidase [Melioribacteraceae bacterium]|nr:M48 family metallopeptidase [Melioribacteraceae bacterium]